MEKIKTQFCTANIASERASHVETKGQTIFAIDIVEICSTVIWKILCAAHFVKNNSVLLVVVGLFFFSQLH